MIFFLPHEFEPNITNCKTRFGFISSSVCWWVIKCIFHCILVKMIRHVKIHFCHGEERELFSATDYTALCL